MKVTDVIRRPIVTEKTTTARETSVVLAFEVHVNANRIDVKRAFEQLFGAKVRSVRTQIMHGKIKRQGRFAGQRPDWKKVWVRLKPGEKVPEVFEGS